ncbi:N-acetyltransferase domain-containing protein [Mycena indigotica]|uniref:N-acetyltransferase domain-containing protein n=1 Tax=Mycena indigotica TaxID=2126181 RepID=A0A8H6SDY9_9AGAR|nr:N-acetyltransferase domain-containing protein [Mycena indigotica]KAF7296981.1 N-acetyltransferase domain-containing protein [Mycena indigotica]
MRLWSSLSDRDAVPSFLSSRHPQKPSARCPAGQLHTPAELFTMSIRLAKPDDLLAIQAANLQNLPENYSMKFWIYHAMTWPQISFVAEDQKGRIVGYVLAKIEEAEEDESGNKPQNDNGKPAEIHGHVNSISVLRAYRRLGLAKKLMLLSQEAMATVYKANYVSLHVRRSNKAAIALYQGALGFKVAKVEAKYYGDGEDALSMRLDLDTGKP